MIPNKSNFKFQELTPITGVKPYVIRFWETEFHEIAPVSSEGGQKLYSRADVETIFKIKKLLFEDKLSIPEAKLRMAETQSEVREAVKEITETSVSQVRPMLLKAMDLIHEIKFKRNW